jgi:phosphoesterase RecJ-like protein
MSQNASFAEIASALRGARRIGCVSHVRPDGDALGSLLGFAQSMELAGKQVIPLSQDGVPWHLAFLPGTEKVRKPDGSVIEIATGAPVTVGRREVMSKSKKKDSISKKGE